MQVRLGPETRMAGPHGVFFPGMIVELPEETAREMATRGLVELVAEKRDAPQRDVEMAVAPSGEIADAPPVETATAPAVEHADGAAPATAAEFDVQIDTRDGIAHTEARQAAQVLAQRKSEQAAPRRRTRKKARQVAQESEAHDVDVSDDAGTD